MTQRKLVALHTINVANGIEKRPKRVEGRVVVGADGKAVMEDVTKIVAIPPKAVFLLDDEALFKDMEKAKAVREAGEDEKVNFHISPPVKADKHVAADPKKPGKTKATAKPADAAPVTDATDADGDSEGNDQDLV